MQNNISYPYSSYEYTRRTNKMLFLLAFLAPAALYAQDLRLEQFNQKRLHRTEQAMWILGGWAAANIAVGAIGMGRTNGSQKAFHQMNVGWGAVNLGLAASGLWTATHADPATFDLYQTTLEHHKLQKLFLFNAGLDAGYMMAGAWMQEKSKTTAKNPDRLKGFGQSLLLQGAFLMVFDLGAYLHHRNLEPDLKPFLQQTEIGFNGHAMELKLRF